MFFKDVGADDVLLVEKEEDVKHRALNGVCVILALLACPWPRFHFKKRVRYRNARLQQEIELQNKYFYALQR